MASTLRAKSSRISSRHGTEKRERLCRTCAYSQYAQINLYTSSAESLSLLCAVPRRNTRGLCSQGIWRRLQTSNSGVSKLLLTSQFLFVYFTAKFEIQLLYTCLFDYIRHQNTNPSNRTRQITACERNLTFSHEIVYTILYLEAFIIYSILANVVKLII
jgi:hypothetical protein